jgi:predicted dehydrogenase
MLGIGIIGGGRILRAHAQPAIALAETRLAGIAEIDPERLAKATETYGCRGCAEYQELLSDPDVEAVVIGLPHWLHKQATIDSLNAGKHVLLEKPMALDTAECDAIMEAARASGKTLMVAHSQHYFPVNIAARKLIREGEIGAPVMATDTWYKPFWEGGQRPPWFLDASKGGGMWPMNGSHMIDRMTFLLGREVTAVKARVGSPVFGLSATDMGMAFLDFEDGVCATLQHLGYRDGVTRFEAEISGTEGQLRFSGDRGGGTLYRSRGGEWVEVPYPTPELPLKPGAELPNPVFGAQMLEFARAVRENRPPAVTAEYGRQVVRVMEACEESSRTGREVRL